MSPASMTVTEPLGENKTLPPWRSPCMRLSRKNILALASKMSSAMRCLVWTWRDREGGREGICLINSRKVHGIFFFY